MSNRFRTLGALALAFSLAACGGDDRSADASQAPASGAQQGSAPFANPEAAAEARLQQQVADLARLGYNDGDEEGSVIRVVEFSDFGCIFCAGFHVDTYPSLYEEFMDDGEVVWKYIPITIGGFPNGHEAALTGECAGILGDFPTMRDHLFGARDEWLESSDPDALFRGYAEALGYDGAEFAACYEGEAAQERIEAGNRMAQQLGVRGTPTFLIEGHPVQGAPPLEAFQQALRDLLAEHRGGR